MAKHLKIGKIGEEAASNFLQEKDYEILEMNWRHRRAEVDIIAKKGDILIFIEVKTRTDDAFGNPASFVTAKKERFLANAANAYMEKVQHFGEIRFDIIGIIIWSSNRMEIRHFEDAFFPK